MSSLLHPEHSVLLMVDIQEKFRPVIDTMPELIRRTGQLLKGANQMNIPVVVTEQYPQGLGYTVEELQALYAPNLRILEKTSFSAWGAPGLPDLLSQWGRDQIVVCGLETHVCINQTVMDLLAQDYSVYLVEDAVSSRHTSDKHTALKKLYTEGAIAVTTEMVLFEWLRDAKHPQFKALQQIILS